MSKRPATDKTNEQSSAIDAIFKRVSYGQAMIDPNNDSATNLKKQMCSASLTTSLARQSSMVCIDGEALKISDIEDANEDW